MVVSLFLTYLYLKWHLQSPFLLLHSVAIDLQEAKESINEEDPRATNSIIYGFVLVWNSVGSTKKIALKFKKLGGKYGFVLLFTIVAMMDIFFLTPPAY